MPVQFWSNYTYNGYKHYLCFDDGGATFIKRKVPTQPSPRVDRAIAFHSKNVERFIWFGEECESNGRCTSNAYITDDAGATFNKLMANVRTCDYVGAVLESEIMN